MTAVPLIDTLLEKLRTLLELLRGSARVAPTPADVIYRQNKLELLRYQAPAGAAPRQQVPVLIVPSLINRHYILDLTPECSFVAHLLSQGFDVYMVSWGRPSGEDRYLTLDEHITGLLRRCVRRTARQAGSEQVTLLGYCMGGTLTAIYAALYPGEVAQLVNLAAPVDFSTTGLLGQWTSPRYLDVDLLVNALGNIPWPLLQATFHLLVPTLNAQKLVYLQDRLADRRFLRHFAGLETWSNDNVSFPGECFRRYIKDLYQQNALIAGRLTIGGRRVALGKITCPTLNIVAQGDHIVPEAAAAPLTEQVGAARSELWLRPGGHIGAIVSRKAARELWPALTAWLEADASASVVTKIFEGRR